MPTYARVAIPCALFLVAVLVYGAQWEYPAAIIFDEAHYVHWSREIAQDHLFTNDLTFRFLGSNFTFRDAPVNAEHPPLAKHLMAWSFRLQGAGQFDLSWDQYHLGCERATKETGSDGRLDPACPPGRAWEGCDKVHRAACEEEARAWRLPSILVGASAVPALYLIGRRLFGTFTGGVSAALLLLLDNLWYLQSRMAMLDVFSAAFAVWAFALALGPSWRSRLLAGLAMGASMGSKFPGMFLLPAFLLLQLLRAPSRRNPALRAVEGALFGLAVPMAAFAATYLPYLIRWSQDGGPGFAVGQLFFTVGYALSVDYGFTFSHPFVSPPIEWIPHVTPTFYYWPKALTPQPPYMYAVGNVAIWWPAVAALFAVPTLIARAAWRGQVSRRPADWIRRARALMTRRLDLTPPRGYLLACAMFLSGFLPWFVLARTTFNYYATLNVPYLALLMAGVLAWAWRRSGPARAAGIAYLGLAGFWFAAWWPIVSGADVSAEYFASVWDLLPWMGR